MRKHARWSGMNVSNIRMGNLGNTMGLRSGRVKTRDSSLKEVKNKDLGYTAMIDTSKNRAIHYWKDSLNLSNTWRAYKVLTEYKRKCAKV